MEMELHEHSNLISTYTIVISLYFICIFTLLHVKLLCILVAAPISIESELKKYYTSKYSRHTRQLNLVY